MPEPATAPPPDEVPTTIAPEPASEPSRALASYEERAVRSRLSSWTGSFAPDEPAPTMTWREAGQEYTAVLKRVPGTDAMSHLPFVFGA